MAPLSVLENQPRHSSRFATRISRRIGEGTKNVVARLGQKRNMDDVAAVNFAGVATLAFTIAAVIIAAVVALTLASNMAPQYIGSVANISNNVSTADWGDDTANALSPTFAMLVSLGGLFALIGLVMLALSLRKGGYGS